MVPCGMPRPKLPKALRRSVPIFTLLREDEDRLLAALKAQYGIKSNGAVMREAFLAAVTGRKPRWDRLGRKPAVAA